MLPAFVAVAARPGGWNARFLGYIEETAAVHPPREPVNLAGVADMLSCIVDGGIIMSKTLDDPRRLERQVLAYRSFVKLMSTQQGATAPAT